MEKKEERKKKGTTIARKKKAARCPVGCASFRRTFVSRVVAFDETERERERERNRNLRGKMIRNNGGRIGHARLVLNY